MISNILIGSDRLYRFTWIRYPTHSIWDNLHISSWIKNWFIYFWCMEWYMTSPKSNIWIIIPKMMKRLIEVSQTNRQDFTQTSMHIFSLLLFIHTFNGSDGEITPFWQFKNIWCVIFLKLIQNNDINWSNSTELCLWYICLLTVKPTILCS